MAAAGPVRIGIIDSGINPAHPHVEDGRIGAASRIGMYQNTSADFLDYLGHGTAVAGAILSHCPEAELYVAKVFDQTLNTRVEVILRAIEWCVEEHDVAMINLSLGTQNPKHGESFESWAKRTILIAAAGALPGGLPRVMTVAEDSALSRDQWRYGDDGLYYASGRPRPIPGRSEADNLGGVSFAVANFTGLAAKERSLGRRLPWERALP